MTHPTETFVSRRAAVCGFLLAILSMLYLANTFAASFEANETVKLNRDATLLFQGKSFRQGSAGESFQVLACQTEQKTVFLATTDPGGKSIAVSVGQDALDLVPRDSAKVRDDTMAAVKAQQFPLAAKIISQALRAKPNDPDLQSARLAIDSAASAAAKLGQAQAAHQATAADVQRRRHNADMTDHVNPLDPNDYSGRERAQQIRAETTRIALEADQALSLAQQNSEAALTALNSILVPADQNGGIPANKSRTGLNHSAAQPKLDEQTSQRSEQEYRNARQQEAEARKQWTEDEAVNPPGLRDNVPTYAQTLDFINGKIASHQQKLWYGKHHQKLILTHLQRITLVDPTLLTPEVKVFETRDQFGQHHVVKLETSGDRNVVESLYSVKIPSEFDHRLSLECEDEHDATRVAAACRHLILMFGGKDELF